LARAAKADDTDRSSVSQILAAVSSLRVLVAGDLCLDRWCRYDPALTEPSRETGIPRIAVVRTEVTPGAGGTVASNVAALGARVDALGLAGEDGFGYELLEAVAARGISTKLVVRVPGIPTFTYTKLINCRTGEEDLPRVDFVYSAALPAEVERHLVARLEHAAGEYDVILVSDQAETPEGGVVTAAMRLALARIAQTHPQVVVWVDSRLRLEHFRWVIVKANRAEAEAASTRALGRADYVELRRRLEARLLVITKGGDGASVVDSKGETVVPARRVEHPVDICGAGDAFSAGAALALKVTGDAIAAVQFGNLVASITIMKKGTGTASPEEVLAREG